MALLCFVAGSPIIRTCFHHVNDAILAFLKACAESAAFKEQDRCFFVRSADGDQPIV